MSTIEFFLSQQLVQERVVVVGPRRGGGTRTPTRSPAPPIPPRPGGYPQQIVQLVVTDDARAGQMRIRRSGPGAREERVEVVVPVLWSRWVCVSRWVL